MRLRTCEYWLPARRQCEMPAVGLYHWNHKSFLDGTASYLVGMGPGPATALCLAHLRTIAKRAGPPDRSSPPDAEQWGV